GNRALLVQTISNLLSNAVKFVPRGQTPSVRIWTADDGTSIRINVEDNGIGIPGPAQQKIFEPFQRAHPKLNYEGTGIGLAIVKKAVERMGGRVGINSLKSG